MEKRNELYTMVALIVVAILLISFIAMNYSENGGQREEQKTIIGTLEFPRDEGAHEDIQEMWELYFTGNGSDGSKYSIDEMWTTQWKNSVKYSYLEIRITENEKLIKWVSYSSFRVLDTSNKSLDIRWASEDGAQSIFSRPEANSSMKGAAYEASFSNGEGYFSFNMNMISQRNIALFGLDGKADMGILGTLNGYIQSDMKSHGNIEINEKNIKIDGESGYYHLWGYIPLDSVGYSAIFMKGENRDIFFFRTYLDKTKPSWEFFYSIGKDEYTMFASHFSSSSGNSTLGYAINEDFSAKDLKGESYTAEILDYFPEPLDPKSYRVYPDQWKFQSSYDKMSWICWPADKYSDEKYRWDGFVTGVDSQNKSMHGYEHTYTYFTSTVSFKNISMEEMDEKAHANISALFVSKLPVNSVVLSYGFFINGMWDNETSNMSLSEGKWYSTVDIPAGATNMSVRIHVEDTSYLWHASEIKYFDV